MANSTNGCGSSAQGSAGATVALPATPFYAPRYHFGMLLGVDDFEAEQGYHRGKGRVHNAWLHREGVVWGMDVTLPEADGRPGTLRGEVRVDPGLALDGAGRELHLDGSACVSLAAWYGAHQADPDLAAAVTLGADGTVTFDAHVVARFRACAARPVPSISQPCDNGGGMDGVAFSRSQETVELLLVPGLAPPRDPPYHRLRLLFRLEPPRTDSGGGVAAGDQAVIDARAAVLALAAELQPAAYLDAFRRFAALDEIDLAPVWTAGDPGAGIFPAPDDGGVVLANLAAITLQPGADGALALASAAVDVTVRPAHVATATIQELLCGPLFALAAPPSGGGAPPDGGDAPPDSGPPPDTAADAGGPRIDPATVHLGRDAVTLEADRPLARGSVQADAFRVSSYEVRGGWHAVEINSVRVERNRRTVHLGLASGFGGEVVRVIAKGTGAQPVLGADLVPLAGRVGGPPGGRDDGNDFVLMISRSRS